MWRILALVDKGHLISQIERTLPDNEREVVFSSTLENVRWLLNSETFHLLIVDDNLLDGQTEELESILASDTQPGLGLIVLTSYRKGHTRKSLSTADNWTFVIKPINRKILLNTVESLLNQIRFPHFVNYLRHKEKYIYRFDNIICASPGMKSVVNLARKVATSKSNVLITGETGTGKEMIAAVMHFNSSRKKDNFVAVHCGSMTSEKLETELFGHEKGTITGADKRRIGRVEQANGGTLFLKEIGMLEAATQAKILRVIQHGAFERMGGTQKVKVDVRIICSSGTDLKNAIEQKTFREDLFYRINVIQIHIPSLRKRKEDIPALGQFYIQKFRSEIGKREVEFSPKAIEAMMDYSWPGNVRELENVIERAVLIGHGSVITPEYLTLGPGIIERNENANFLDGENLDLDQLERSAIMEALSRADGIQKDAAKLLGISPRVIHYKISKHNIS